MGENPNKQRPPASAVPEDAQQASMLTGNAAVLGALVGKSDFNNKLVKGYAEEVNRRGHKLEMQPWYLGMLSAADVPPYLKEVGAFAIHATDQQGAVRLMLTVRGAQNVHHLDITFDALGRGWSLPKGQFHKTVIDMVEFHKTTVLPNIPESLKLVEHLTRPSWFLRHDEVKYEKNDLLGKGNFCEVFRGTLSRRNKAAEQIAVKVCNASWHTNDPVSVNTNVKEQEARESIVKEGSVMSKITHANVIKFFGICCDSPPILIALELCPGDSLLRHLQRFKNEISLGERVKFLLEASEGMVCLEKNQLIHRDLAARNCLISRHGRIKIADFGLSKMVTELAGEQWSKQQMPVRWMAPETLKPVPEYSAKSDVWSFGVLIYEVFNNGDKPWPEWENKRIATHIRRGQMLQLPPYTPLHVFSLVCELWKMNPADRPDFVSITRRLRDTQQAYPAPPANFLTTCQIKGVNTSLDPEEQKSEDIAQDIVATTMGSPNVPAVAGAMSPNMALDVSPDVSYMPVPMQPQGKVPPPPPVAYQAQTPLPNALAHAGNTPPASPTPSPLQGSPMPSPPPQGTPNVPIIWNEKPESPPNFKPQRRARSRFRHREATNNTQDDVASPGNHARRKKRPTNRQPSVDQTTADESNPTKNTDDEFNQSNEFPEGEGDSGGSGASTPQRKTDHRGRRTSTARPGEKIRKIPRAERTPKRTRERRKM